MVIQPKPRKPIRKKLPYKVIKSRKQFERYLGIWGKLSEQKGRAYKEEVLLLDCLLDKWRRDNDPLQNHNPVALVKILIRGSWLNANQLAKELKISKGHMSDILHYKKNISKKMSFKLAEYFALPQQLFCGLYDLKKKPAKKL
jgi:HTH-type transcriptional regulator/antitoxin HigA